eukprot:5697634-Pyramimonas_sp.AAC.1
MLSGVGWSIPAASAAAMAWVSSRRAWLGPGPPGSGAGGCPGPWAGGWPPPGAWALAACCCWCAAWVACCRCAAIASCCGAAGGCWAACRGAAASWAAGGWAAAGGWSTAMGAAAPSRVNPTALRSLPFPFAAK